MYRILAWEAVTRMFPAWRKLEAGHIVCIIKEEFIILLKSYYKWMFNIEKYSAKLSSQARVL